MLMACSQLPLLHVTNCKTLTKTAPNRPWYFGLFAKGIIESIRMMPPDVMPAELIPAMALPTINATELGAAPQIAEPTSNKPISMRKTYFGV